MAFVVWDVGQMSRFIYLLHQMDIHLRGILLQTGSSYRHGRGKLAGSWDSSLPTMPRTRDPLSRRFRPGSYPGCSSWSYKQSKGVKLNCGFPHQIRIHWVRNFLNYGWWNTLLTPVQTWWGSIVRWPSLLWSPPSDLKRNMYWKKTVNI